jgi:hypothetical protein
MASGARLTMLISFADARAGSAVADQRSPVQ